MIPSKWSGGDFGTCLDQQSTCLPNLANGLFRRVHGKALTLHQLLCGLRQNSCRLLRSNPLYNQSYYICRSFCHLPVDTWAHLCTCLPEWISRQVALSLPACVLPWHNPKKMTKTNTDTVVQGLHHSQVGVSTRTSLPGVKGSVEALPAQSDLF